MKAEGAEKKRCVLSVQEVADLLGLTYGTMKFLVRQPDFPCFKVGRQIVIPKREFKEWFYRNLKNKTEILGNVEEEGEEE